MNDKLNIRFQLLLTKDLKVRLDVYCRTVGATMGGTIRLALGKFLKGK